MRLYLLTTIMSFLLPFCSMAQRDVAFIANAETDHIIVGQPFEVHYELRNAKIESFNAPDFRTLQKLGGPSVTNSLQIINGRRSSTHIYTYTLAAPNAGNFTIPPAIATVEGQTIRSNPLEIEVKPFTEKQEANGEVFIEIVPSDTSAFVGQQIVLDYILYYKKPVESINAVNELDFKSFYKKRIKDFPASRQKTVINGETYSRRIVQREILFGQRSGTYTLGPLFLNAELPVGNNRSPFSFFRETETKEIHSDPINLHIQPLPSQTPPGFSGGVGAFTMEAQATQQQLSLGEAMELSVKINGDGDPNFIDAPVLEINGAAEAFEPQLIFEKEETRQGRMTFTKSWNYLVVPESKGAFSVYASLVYLDPEQEVFDTVRTQAIDFWANPAKVINTNDQEEILNEGEEESLYWIYWTVAALLILLFSMGLYYRLKVQRSSSFSTRKSVARAIQTIEQEIIKDDPDITGIKEQLKDLVRNIDKTDLSSTQLEEWIRKLDYFQFSPNKEVESIRKLLGEILEELRKA